MAGRKEVILYRTIRGLLRLALQVFFRRIEVVGREQLPPEGSAGTILCGNHPNSLLDPALLTAVTDRVVHFAAKDVLFRSRALRPLLRAMGAVPVRRRQDHGGERVDNAAAFEALIEVLERGGAIGIFPEGLSHDAAQLQRLKTGAARLAFAAKARAPSRRVAVVPTGLNYLRRNRFRSCVLVQYGEPIEIDEARLLRWRRDERAAVRALTEEIEQQLRALTINAEDWETLWVLDGVRRLYQPANIPLAARVELARRFNAHFPRVRDHPEVRALYDRVRRYLLELSALGISDDVLRRELGAFETGVYALRYAVLLLLWLPLAAAGAVVHVPLLLLLAAVGERLAPRKDVIATTKFVAGLAAVVVSWLVAAVALGWWWGLAWGLAAAVALPVSGYALLRVLGRMEGLRRMLGTLARTLMLRREIARLRRERIALEHAVADVVARYKPPDLELLFPREGRDTEEEWTL